MYALWARTGPARSGAILALASVRILDRYLIRQTIGPTLLALAVFTFLLAVSPMLEYMRDLLAKGVPVPTVAYLLMKLVWQALAQALPMAFLTGLLIALGRLSSDRESVALLASGVSPLRLLRPVLLMGVLVGAADMYILVKAVPDGNQAFREVTFPLVLQQGERDIKPHVFFERFPGLVVYVREVNPAGGWNGVLLADSNRAGPPLVTLAESGRLVLDEGQRLVRLVLTGAARYIPGSGASPAYSVAIEVDPLSIKIPPESVFGPGKILPGLHEMHVADLLKEIDAKRARGDSPHREIIHLHQMFSFPVACVVFAVVGLGLGLNTRRDGKFASLVLGLGVILLYWTFLVLAESRVQGEAWTKGTSFPAAWARWIPNIALGLVGIMALWRRCRPPQRDRWGALLARWTRREASPDPGGEPAAVVQASPTPGGRSVSITLPFLRLLDRYVGGRYLRIIALSFIALIAIVYIGTFLDLSDKVFKGQADGWTFLRFLWYSTPQYVVWVVPFSTLVATLATMGALARTSELTVMRAAGISLYRAALPVLVLAFILSAALFGLDEGVLAKANMEAARLEDSIRGRVSHTLDIRNQNWLADQAHGRMYHYAAFDDSRQTLLGLSVFAFTTEPYRLASHTWAKAVTAGPSGWQAADGWTQRFTGSGDEPRRTFSTTALELAPLEDFRSARVDPSRLSFRELLEYNRRLGASGFSVQEHRVNLHRKLAFPLGAVVLTLLAIPLGVATGRHGALYGMGLAIALAVAYYLIQTFFIAAGTAGVLPAGLSAWAANLLFLTAALYLLLTART